MDIDLNQDAATNTHSTEPAGERPRPSGVTLAGVWTEWTVCDTTRRYGTVPSLNYTDAERVIKTHLYSGETGKGHQRKTVERHVRALKRAMETGEFTPTPVSAALAPQHALPKLKPDGTFSLVVDPTLPLLLTDGGHRLEALGLLVEDLEERLEKATDQSEQEKLARWLQQARSMPLTVTVYFDGDPQRDFVNLQAGKRVDPSHLRSLALSAGAAVKPEMRLAFDVAKLLHRDSRSPFTNQVKFDSLGHLALPIATLTATGGSDMGTSLVGLAKVGLAAGKGAAFLAAAVTAGFGALKADSEASEEGAGILAGDKVLTPPFEGGSRGASTMLVGVGVCLAHRLIALNKETPDETDLTQLVEAANRTLNVPARGNFSGPVKRKLLGRFAKEFFADTAAERYQGVPKALLETLSCSAFDVTALPKKPKTKAKRTS